MTAREPARSRRVVLLVLLCACAVACGEKKDGPDGGNGDPDAGIDVSDLEYRPCDVAARVGEFQVGLEQDFTGVQGRVYDGIVPRNVPDLLQEEGECRLYTPRGLFCDPRCGAGETCGEDLTCIPEPSARDVGTVTVAGMEVPVEMSPRPPGYFYTNPDPLPHPGFAPGAGMRLAASGGDYEPFALLGWGVSPLVATVDEVPVEEDAPVSVAWEAPDDPGPAVVHLRLDINLHGATARWIECDVPDTGAFEIPVTLVNPMFEAGFSGFPLVSLSRRTTDSTTIEPGCVELRVTSGAELPVQIPGLTSCTKDADCPEGETCQSDLSCG